MSNEDLKDELERLRKENEALRKSASSNIRMKVSEKGAVSIYGMGRFPVTLYRTVVETARYVDRDSSLHCRERSATKEKRLKRPSEASKMASGLTLARRGLSEASISSRWSGG